MTLEQAIEVLISRYNSGVIRSRTNDDEWRLATDAVIVALREKAERERALDPDTGLVPCGCGEWIYTIEKGSCMDYHVTAKCSECGWDWFSKDGVGNCSAVFGAFITNGDSKRDEAERFLIENAKANNKLNYCPNCGAKMEDKPCE